MAHTGNHNARFRVIDGGKDSSSDSKERFATLYRESYRKVFGYLCTMLMDRTLAEDVAAQAYLKAYRAFATFDETRASFSTWVITIARNYAIQYLRKNGRVMSMSDKLDQMEPSQTDERIETYGNAAFATSLLNSLDAEDRQLVYLKYYEEMPNKQIAEVLGMNASTVGTRLSRAMARLRAAAQAC